MNLDVQPAFFATETDFRKWLEANHDTATELSVGFYKVGSGRPSMTWGQSVDQAICFGWIDGVRKSLGSESYFIRFTPRKPGSIWSAVNIEKVKALKTQGLMRPAGLAAFERRKESKSRVYSYEKGEAKLSAEYEKQFKANKKAWAYFQSMPPSYQRPAIHWVMAAKQEKTRAKRLDELIRDSAAGRKIKMLSY